MIRKILPVLLVLLSACAQLPPRPALPSTSAPALGRATRLDALTGAAEAKHPGAAGFRLVKDGPEAFALRMTTAALAGRSLDVQSYIWHADMTGLALADTLIEAAERGVKVRLLLDDLDARAKNYGLAALAAHPNIEVRMFNPLPSRKGVLALVGDFLGSGRRLNHRMHNKTWIADNRIGIVGGRNLGNEYFGADAEVNFVDLDFALVGPVVRTASRSFDRYWNASVSYPIETLSADGVNPAALAKLRTGLAQATQAARTSAYSELLRRDDAVQRLLTGDWPMTWSTEYRFVSDDPSKALTDPDHAQSSVLKVIGAPLTGAQHSVTIVSPYFVPGKGGTAWLVKRAKEVERVRILTNSLAANDVAMVHGGYSRYRKDLLAGGVQLWELKPVPGTKPRASLFGSRGASLHTKALAADGDWLFVGSYNLDPRSTSLNCEQGVLVRSPPLAGQFEGIFGRQSAGERAWQLRLRDGKLAWTDGTATFHSDPMASGGRRFQAWLAGLLPVESQL